MVTKEVLRSTLAQMEPGQEIKVRHQGRSVNAIRNAASLIGRERSLVFSVHADWDAGISTVKCVRPR